MPCADVFLLCVQMQTKTIHRRAARDGLRDTLRQKTASSKVNVGGMFGDRAETTSQQDEGHCE